MSQPEAQLSKLSADLKLFDMSFSRPDADSRDFSDAEATYNPEIQRRYWSYITIYEPFAAKCRIPSCSFFAARLTVLAATCSDVAVAFPPSAPHAPPARIHAAVYQFAGKISIAAEYSGIEPQRADLWCSWPGVFWAAKFSEKADEAPECPEETAEICHDRNDSDPIPADWNAAK